MPRPVRVYSASERAIIIAEYVDERDSLRAVSARHHTSDGLLRVQLEDWGVVVRPRGKKASKEPSLFTYQEAAACAAVLERGTRIEVAALMYHIPVGAIRVACIRYKRYGGIIGNRGQ